MTLVVGIKGGKVAPVVFSRQIIINNKCDL